MKVPSTWLDRVISWVSPSWGLARTEARLFDAYQRETVDDVRKLFQANPSPIQESETNRASLLGHARKLDRTNDFAHGVLNSIATNIVGRGFRFEARAQLSSGELDTDTNEAIEFAWRDWSRSVDSTGQQSLSEILRIAERDQWVAGECFLVQTTRPDRFIPFAIDLFESERLSSESTTTTSGRPIIEGVEFDALGAIVAYHFHDAHPEDPNGQNITRIPAERVIHLKNQRRPGEVRGITRLASVIPSFQALNQYLEFELTKAKVASAFAAMIKRGTGRGGFDLAQTASGKTQDDIGNLVGHLYGGMIVPGGPNDSIEAVQSSVTSTAFEPFVRLILRKIGAGLNVSYELIARDFSAHNFSSIRQSFLEDRRHWEPRQDALVEVCQRIWTWWIEAALNRRLAPAIAFESAEEKAVEFHAPGWDWVDPVKEKQADALGISTGIQNVKATASKHGFDLAQNARDLAEFMQLLEELGIPLPSAIFSGQQKAQAQEAPGDEEDSEPEESADERSVAA